MFWNPGKRALLRIYSVTLGKSLCSLNLTLLTEGLVQKVPKENCCIREDTLDPNRPVFKSQLLWLTSHMALTSLRLSFLMYKARF